MRCQNAKLFLREPLVHCVQKYANVCRVFKDLAYFQMTSTQILVSGILGALILLANPGEARIVRAHQSEVAGRSQTRIPKSELDQLARHFRGRLGFYAKELTSETEYSWNADQRFPPASVLKLPVMVELYRQAVAARLQLDDRRPLPDDISTHGSGVLKKREGAVELSLRQYCRLMMVRSDNMATDLLIRTVGLGAVNRFLERGGFKSTRVAMEIGRWHYAVVGMMDAPINRRNDERQLERMRAGKFDDEGLAYSDSLENNVCGPRDMGILLERLYRGELASRLKTGEMLDLMRASLHKQTIAKYVKSSVGVANKYGGSRRIAADVGIVELPNRPIVIAAFVLGDDPKDRSRREILARMSRLVIAAVDPSAVTALPAPASPDRGP